MSDDDKKETPRRRMPLRARSIPDDDPVAGFMLGLVIIALVLLTVARFCG